MAQVCYSFCLLQLFRFLPIVYSQSRPNIILIVADDLGWNDVSFHGSQQIPTPHIDKLANRGVILNNYYVTPICTPSRSALMTGKYPIHLGTQHNVIYGTEPWGLGLEEKILPQYLKEIGYKAHIVGKWHLGFFNASYTPCFRGFDSHYGYWLGHGDYFDHTGQEWNDWGLDFRDNMDPVLNQTGSYATDLFTNRAVSIIERHNQSKPLFLYVSHLATHSANTYDPLQTTKEYYNRFPNIPNRNRRLFAGMVAGLDDSVGKILKTLEDRGLANNSIIIFTTDNGGPAAGFDFNYANNWPLRGVKDTLWEGGVRGTAFIWSQLLQQRPRKSMQMMHITDWLPTILSAANHPDKNVANSAKLDGLDVWSALVNGSSSPRNEVLLNIDHERRVYALRMDKFKLVIGTTYDGNWDGWYPPEGRNTSVALSATIDCGPPPGRNVRQTCQPKTGPCLFDIEIDPCEFRNLAASRPRVLRIMMKRLRDYNATVVTPRNKPGDPRAKPKLHGYIWTPWVT